MCISPLDAKCAAVDHVGSVKGLSRSTCDARTIFGVFPARLNPKRGNMQKKRNNRQRRWCFKKDGHTCLQQWTYKGGKERKNNCQILEKIMAMHGVFVDGEFVITFYLIYGFGLRRKPLSMQSLT
ncbi:hypothetical protein EVAR_101932_1 [Eumeta japonica]|uniref:Uncharacterized protein n=1 Tax=Eumeta variegata TaxID=151549 RepID=A0A4C1TSE0_EUMVA|nr:hypothetical protein EVAR_101932_1 [Eumeta japonica]